MKAINEYRGLMEAAECDIPEDEWAPIFLKHFLTVLLVHTRADTIISVLRRDKLPASEQAIPTQQ